MCSSSKTLLRLSSGALARTTVPSPFPPRVPSPSRENTPSCTPPSPAPLPWRRRRTPTPSPASGRQFWQYPLLPKSMLQKVSATSQSSDRTHMGLSLAKSPRLTHAPRLCEYAHPLCVGQSLGSRIVSHCRRSAHVPSSEFHAHRGVSLRLHASSLSRSPHSYVRDTHRSSATSYVQNLVASQCAASAAGPHSGKRQLQCRVRSSHPHPSLTAHASEVANRPQSMPQRPSQ